MPAKASVLKPSPTFSPPCQLSLKPSSQSLRSGNWSERKSHRLPRLPKRHSHDDMLLLAQLSLPSSPSSLNEDSLSTTSELLSSRRARRIPKVASLEGPPWGWLGRWAGRWATPSGLSFPNLGLLPQFSLNEFWIPALAFLFHLVKSLSY